MIAAILTGKLANLNPNPRSIQLAAVVNPDFLQRRF